MSRFRPPSLSPRNHRVKTRRAMNRWLTILTCFVFASPALAIVRRYDIADSSYLDFGNTFPSVVWFNNGCSGALIAPDWVMTACHCVDNLSLGADPTFHVGNSSQYLVDGFDPGIE